MYIDFNEDETYEQRIEALLREIFDVPAVDRPPLGQNPFNEAPVDATPAEPVPAQPHEDAAASAWNDPWFATEREAALPGFGRVGLGVRMEVQFALHAAASRWSSKALLEAVQGAEIRTFGWPIAVVLSNREEYRPRPRDTAIFAEIEVGDRSSYDYWSVRSNGDFFLLKSIFEDNRDNSAIFFNTRIVRTTETLLFCERMYTHLGVPEGRHVNVRIAYDGLAGRRLTSSTPYRMLIPRATQAASSDNEVTLPIGSIETNIVEHVQALTAPLFMLFDFEEFAHEIYEDIVTRCIKGDCS